MYLLHTCMRRPGCFCGWSMVLLALARHHIVWTVCSVPFFLVSERSWRNRLLYTWYLISRVRKRCPQVIEGGGVQVKAL